MITTGKLVLMIQFNVLQSLADKALASFIIIQAALKRSQRLSVFAKRPDLNERLPNFQVKLHCLHALTFLRYCSLGCMKHFKISFTLTELMLL